MDSLDEMFHAALEAYENANYQFAEQAFLKIIELQPLSPSALLNLGNVYFQTERRQEAFEMWRKSVAINPLEAKAYLNLGNHYYEVEEVHKAIFYWLLFLKLSPKHAFAHYNLGLAYEKLRDYKRSYEYYKQFMILKPYALESQQLHERLNQMKAVADHNLRQAEISLQQGNFVSANEAYSQSLSLLPVHPKIYQHYASVLYRLGQMEEALFWYSMANQDLPGHVGILINIAVIQEKLGRPFHSIWAYHKCLTKAPDVTPERVKRQFDELLSKHSKTLFDEMLLKIQSCLDELKVDEAELLLSRMIDLNALCPTKVKQVNELKGRLKLMLDPLRKAGHQVYERAEALYEEGQYESAIVAYESYLELQPRGEFTREANEKIRQMEKTLAAMAGEKRL